MGNTHGRLVWRGELGSYTVCQHKATEPQRAERIEAKPDKHHHHNHQKTHKDKQEDRRIGNQADVGGIATREDFPSRSSGQHTAWSSIQEWKGKSIQEREQPGTRQAGENTTSQLTHTANRTPPIFTVPSHSPSALPQTSKEELTIYLLMPHLFPKCI